MITREVEYHEVQVSFLVRRREAEKRTAGSGIELPHSLRDLVRNAIDDLLDVENLTVDIDPGAR